jgi:hypothetical protein
MNADKHGFADKSLEIYLCSSVLPSFDFFARREDFGERLGSIREGRLKIGKRIRSKSKSTLRDRTWILAGVESYSLS